MRSSVRFVGLGVVTAAAIAGIVIGVGLGCGSTGGVSMADGAVPGTGGQGTRSGGATGTSGGASGTGGRAAGSGGATTNTGGAGTGTGGRAAGTGGVKGTGGTSAGTGGSVATGSGGATTSGASPMVGVCKIYPADNAWNRDVSGDPVHANSAAYIAKMLPTKALHPDWGTVTDNYGIPFLLGTGAAPQTMTWTTSWGPNESDKLACASGGGQFCYPIPLTAPIEGGTSAPTDNDRHVLYVDTAGAPDNCTLYELYEAQNPTSAGWKAANGAIFHLGSNALRPDGWTSGDAAGLPILPGLVRLDEVKAGAIRHAIRFTMNNSYQGYIHPATHAAGSSDATLAPMGLRLRLKASFDTSTYSGAMLVILTAMKKYGLIFADNGSDWYITGESNEGWSSLIDGIVSGMGKVHGSDFEVVDSGPISKAGL